MSNAIELGIKISADGKGAESTINSLNKTIEKVGDSSKKASQSLGGIEKAAQGLGSAATTAGRALAGLGVAFSARSLIQTADAYSGIVAKLKLVSGSAQEFATAQARLFELSQRNMTPLAETVQLYSRLATSMRDLGRSQAETLTITDLVGKSIRISGADASSAAAGILQFSQAIGSGVLRGDEFNSMMENSPRLAKALADGLNVPIGALREMAAQGELTADKVINAILSQSQAIQREYTQMPLTVSGAFQQIQNALTQYVGQTDQASGASRQFAETLSIIAANLNDILDPLAKVTNEVIKIEVGGWLTFVDLLKEAKTNLKEMAGLKDAGQFDPEISKLMKWGSGRASIGEIAGPLPQAQEAQKQFFDGVKRGAEGATAALAKLSKEQKAIYDAAIKYKLDPAMMLGLAQRESGFNPSIVNKKDGGRGLFQFMPATWAGVQKQAGLSPNFNDAFITEKHVDAAMRYMVSIKSIVKNARDVRDYLAAWNYGPERMVKAINAGKAATSVTTAGHVPFAMKYMEQWRQKLAGAGVESDDKTTKLASKEWEDYYKHRLNLIDQLKDRQNAANDLTVAQQKAALEKIKAAAEDAQKNAEIKIKMAVDQQGMEAAIKAIEDAKTAQDNLLRDASSLGNKDVSKARIELAAIQKKIMETQKAGRWEERGLELTTKREVAEKKLAEAKIAAGTNDMQLQAALAANAEKYDTMKRVAMKEMADLNVKNVAEQKAAQEAELSYLQKQEQFRQQIGEQAAQGAKAAIDSQLQQMEAAMAGQKAERDAQLQNLTGLAQIQQARQNINADLQDQLGLIEAEKQAAQAKLAIDQQMLGYQEQMLQAQLATTSERERRLEIESAIAKIHLQQADNLRAVQNAATQANAAAAKAQSEAAKGMGGLDVKEVKERQLRENAFWDQLIGRAQEYANVWNQIGENSNDAFSTMFVASNKFIKNIDQISKAYKEMAADGGGGSFALDMAEGMAQAQNALNMVAQSLILVRNQYEKGTAEYKKYDQAAAGVAVAAKVAAVAEGILAVVHQMSSGDPYSAIPRALAVAAMLASMGISTGASGSGGISAATQKRQETQGTGTVFGDSQAQSQSIANSLEIIKSNSSNDLNYSAAMLRALEDLSLNILALANQVTMSVMPSIDAAIKASGMKFGKTNISLFSGFNKQLTDAGIGWFETSLEKIFSGGFTAKMYADVTKSFEVMQSALSSETTTYVRNASKEVTNQIAQIFRDMVKALQEGGKAFGLSGQDVLDSLKGFKIGMEQISLKDMSMEEQTAALNAVFSKFTDKMAERLNKSRDLQLRPFRKAGEGMAETYFRVSEGINRANGELERLNVNAIKYTDILSKDKQGDVAGAIVRQSLAAQTQLSQSVRDYVNVLTGSAEDIIEAYKQIISASNLLKTAGIGDANLSQKMTNAAGGLSEFVSAMESFNENFLSEADRYAGDVRVLSEQFGALGYALPDSKEAFAAMVRGIDTSTEAGQKLFGQMIALSESFAQVANEAQAIRDKYASILDPFKAISDRIKEVGTDFGKLLGGVVGDSQGRINSIGNAANQQRGTLTARQSELQKEIDSRLTQLFNLYSYADKVQADLDAELAKKPKNQNAKKIKRLQEALNQAKLDIQGIIGMNQVALDEIASINLRIANIDAQEGIDKAAESARLALEKQGIIDDARLAMGKTLEDIFNGLAQTIQQAQQRLQSVLDLQKSLASQIAQLQGPQAVFGLASTDRNNAFGAIDTYMNSLADGRARDVGVEVGLLNTAQQAVMAKYNAEIAAIQEAEREYIAAETERLNAALQLQIDAINDALDAQIKAQSKLDAAAQKAMQKQFDDEQKALRKAHDAQLKALGDELDAANRLRDAIKGIQDYVRGMALGGNSPLSPEQRLAEAQRQYQELLARAQGGDADAMQKLSGASDAYLEASKQYYGSGTQYANTFDAVKNAMSAIGGMSAPDPDSIQSRIDALREAQADEMDRLRELQAEKLDALREKQQEAIEAMRQSAQKQIEAAQKATQQAIADLSDPTKNAAMRAAREAAERDLAKLAELAELTRIEAAKQAEEAKQKAQEQAEAALRMAQDQLEALQAGTRLSAQQLGVLSGILQGMGLQPIPIEGYAKGGYAKAGLALVGEQGPEIVRFERPAQVMTADETRDALRGGNDAKIVQAIAELKAEMRAVVVTQSNANPQIIAELSEMKNRLAKMERTQRFTVGS